MSLPLYYGVAVLLGFLVSILSGVLGVGGGLLTTPALRLILATPAYIALGTTLPAIIPTAFSSAWRYARAGFVNRSAFLFTAGFGTAGSLLGSYSTQFFGGSWMMIFTAVVIFLLGVQMWTQSRRPQREDNALCQPQPAWKKAVVGFSGGLVSGFLGVGGGLLLVPAYMLVLEMPMKECLGTSLASVAVIAIPGTVVHALLGHIDPWLALALAVLAIPGANMGAGWALKRKNQQLVRIFAVFLLTVALVFGLSELIRLFHPA